MERQEILDRITAHGERVAKGERVPVLPPPEHIQYAGHHWLRVVAYGSGALETVVLQWAPNAFEWYHSGCVATNARPIDTTGWIYIAPCPLPLLDPEGWKLVPVKLTRNMKDAVSKKVDDFSKEHVRLFVSDIWEDLLREAPKP